MRSSRRITAPAIAGAAAIALLAGCSSGGGGTESGGDVELTVTTFGTFGYDDLYTEYEEANPGVTITANNIDTGGNARTDAFTKLAAGSGLSDVVAIEEGWLGAIMEVSDQFVDLRDHGIEERKADWVDWKYGQATDPDGRVIGYGTDIGPEGLCYNGPAFEAAGLPTDRAEVAELFGGEDATWDDYFAVGKQYNEATGKAWYDHSGFVWNAMVNQLDEGYYTADGELNVEGNAELTPGRLTGHFDPSQVLTEGYAATTFVDGPLIEALRTGSMLYVEEVNRVPEETLNVLITVMSEGELHVPRLGRVAAAPGFRLVAAMNPFDGVGTARISAAIYDRVCRITMGYQDAGDEHDIVGLRAPEVPGAWRSQVVDLVRRTRGHVDIRIGSSVRGAIDTVRLAVSLGGLRDQPATAWRIGYDAAQVALSGRIRLHEACTRTPEEIVDELYRAVFGDEPTDDEGDEDGGAPGGA